MAISGLSPASTTSSTNSPGTVSPPAKYETLGLKIVNDVIYTSGRDQITRYYDFNNDGEADYYENFNNEITSSDGFHEFVFDLQTDSEGNFYLAKAGPGARRRPRVRRAINFGTITARRRLVVEGVQGRQQTRSHRDAASARRTALASAATAKSPPATTKAPGSRARRSIGSRKASFYGVVNTATHKTPLPRLDDKPLCWLSHNDFDNSGGGQVWVTSDKWGPLKGELLHVSYGKSSLFLVMKEEVERPDAGRRCQIPAQVHLLLHARTFQSRRTASSTSPACNGRPMPAKPTGFDRVRYTGKPVYSVNGLKCEQIGVRTYFHPTA